MVGLKGFRIMRLITMNDYPLNMQPKDQGGVIPTPARQKPSAKRRNHYSVYVIELAMEVLDEPRFKKSNPGYIQGKPCIYVGMTGINPDIRFDKHKAGIQSNWYVKKFGVRLMPEHYDLYNPMSYDQACRLEVKLAIDFRESGYGVWQA